MKKTNKLSFDVMLGERFIKTFEINQGPFVINESEIRKFVEDKLPTLRGKKYYIAFN